MGKMSPATRTQIRQHRALLLAIILMSTPARLVSETAPLITLQDGPQIISISPSYPVIDGVRMKFLEFDAPAMAGIEVAVSTPHQAATIVQIERRLGSGAWEPVPGTMIEGHWSGSLVRSGGRHRIAIGLRDGVSDRVTVSPKLTPPARNRIPLTQRQSGRIISGSLRSGTMRMQNYYGDLVADQSYRFKAHSADFPVVLIARFSKTGEELRSTSARNTAILDVRASDNGAVTLMVVSEDGATGAFELTYDKTAGRSAEPQG